MTDEEYLVVDERAREVFAPEVLVKMLLYAKNYYKGLNDNVKKIYRDHAKWLPDKFAWNRTTEGEAYWRDLVHDCIKNPRGTAKEEPMSQTTIDGQLYVV